MALNAELPMAPSGWRVREALSYDLPHLWPAEYEAAVRRFEQRRTAERAAFLRRSGVRRCVLPMTEPRQFRVVAEVPGWNMRVFECDPGATRVFIAPWSRSRAIPPISSGSAMRSSTRRCPTIVVRMAALPACCGPRGRAGGAVCAHRRGRTHAPSSSRRRRGPACWSCAIRTIRRGPPTSTVIPAQIARANGLYRAVRCRPAAT